VFHPLVPLVPPVYCPLVLQVPLALVSRVFHLLVPLVLQVLLVSLV
jgi:hypothetical protein